MWAGDEVLYHVLQRLSSGWASHVGVAMVSCSRALHGRLGRPFIVLYFLIIPCSRSQLRVTVRKILLHNSRSSHNRNCEEEPAANGEVSAVAIQNKRGCGRTESARVR